MKVQVTWHGLTVSSVGEKEALLLCFTFIKMDKERRILTHRIFPGLPVVSTGSQQRKCELPSSGSSSSLPVFPRRVKPLSSTPGTGDNGPAYHTMHCPDTLNLWEGEHPYAATQ